jgi:hypothetical protein
LDRLTCRRANDFGQRQRPSAGLLILRVERLDRHDQVAIELDAHGPTEIGRPDVEQRATHRERAGIFDERNAEVTGLAEACDEPISVEPVFRDDAVRARAHHSGRHDLARERCRGEHHDAPARTRSYGREARHARHRCATVWIDWRIRRRLVCNESEHRVVGTAGEER